jgi:hypothetical protein
MDQEQVSRRASQKEVHGSMTAPFLRRSKESPPTRDPRRRRLPSASPIPSRNEVADTPSRRLSPSPPIYSSATETHASGFGSFDFTDTRRSVLDYSDLCG